MRGCHGSVALKVLFHESEGSSETWYLIVKDDGSYWVEHVWPQGSATELAGRFIGRLSEGDLLLKEIRIAITKTLMDQNRPGPKSN